MVSYYFIHDLFKTNSEWLLSVGLILSSFFDNFTVVPILLWLCLQNMFDNAMVIRQKVKSQNDCYKKTKHVKFSEKSTFLTPEMHTYLCISGGKNC